MKYFRLALVLFLLFSFTGCGCEHEWSVADCITPIQCSKCGEINQEIMGDHSFNDATCTTPKTCSLCGKTEGESLGHDFDKATCTSAQQCKNCSEEQGEALGHELVDGKCTRCEYQELLSEKCDMVLCTAYDDENYYELVANQIDSYPDSTFEVGVIKNNKWLVKMSKKSPFLDSKGWWKGCESQNTPGEFIYLSNGCFYYIKDQGVGNYEMIYKPDTGVSFEVFRITSFSPYLVDNQVDYSKIVNENGEVLTMLNDENRTFSCINMNTGKSLAIPFKLTNTQNDLYIGLLSDGVFYAKSFSPFSGYDYYGFFDLDGNQIINLLDYELCDLGDYMFHDGEYTITCKNSSDVEYDITFDTKGKVIKKEKK